jgi:hypothetical protein
VVSATITFTDAMLNNRTLPKYSWTVSQDGAIHVDAETPPLSVKLWQASNPTTRDFRNAFHPEVVWTSSDLTEVAPGEYLGNVSQPGTGARAYFVELTFDNTNNSPIPQLSANYVFTTEIRVKSALALHPWPFESAFDTASPLVAVAAAEHSAAARNATASALAMKQEPDSDGACAPLAAVAADALETNVESAVDLTLLWMDEDLSTAAVEIESDGEELADYLWDDSLSELLA